MEAWTDPTPSMWGEDMYPTVSCSMGTYVGSNGSDYSMIAASAMGDPGDVIEITFTTIL